MACSSDIRDGTISPAACSRPAPISTLPVVPPDIVDRSVPLWFGLAGWFYSYYPELLYVTSAIIWSILPSMCQAQHHHLPCMIITNKRLTERSKASALKCMGSSRAVTAETGDRQVMSRVDVYSIVAVSPNLVCKLSLSRRQVTYLT